MLPDPSSLGMNGLTCLWQGLLGLAIILGGVHFFRVRNQNRNQDK